MAAVKVITPTVTRSYKEQVKSSDPHGIEASEINEIYLDLLKGYEKGIKRSAIGLFISQLRSAANSNKKPNEAYQDAYYQTNITDAKKSTKNESLGNVKFVNELPWMKDNDPMYKDWVNFFCNLGKRLDGTDLDANAITFIQNLSIILDKSHPDEYAFAVAVVKTFVHTLTNAKRMSVLDDITKWATATNGTYYHKGTIIDTLFPDRIKFESPANVLGNPYEEKADVPTTKINAAIKDAFKQSPPCPEVYWFDKYRYNLYAQKILASIMDDVKEEVDTLTTEPVITSPFLDSISQHMSKPQQPTKKYRYIRKADKVLYIVTKDGTETPAEKFQNEGDTVGAVCKTNGINVDKVRCDDFFHSCIGGRNLGDCKKFLTNSTFWVEGIQSFLDELNLYLAHKAFIKYKIPTTTRDGLRVYVSTAEWHKKLEDMLNSGNSDGLTQVDIGLIKSNSHLNAIIDMTVEQINSWPAILNDNVIDEPDPNQQSGGSLTRLYLIGGHGAQLHPSMPRPLVAPGSIHGITVGKVGTLQQSFQNILNLLPQMVQRMPGMPNISTVPFLSSLATQPRLASSGPINIDTYNIQSNEFFYLYNKINVLIKSIDAGLPQWLETTFNIHKSALEQRKIKVESNDLKSITSVIDGLKKTEKIILTALKGMIKYALFFETDLSPAIMSLSTGNPTEDTHLVTLKNLQSKTAVQMLRMGEIATKKIDTYCSKSTKVGGICEQIASLQ